eukprot:6944785-Pyramimonas_sp.AAC.1
MGRQSRAPLLRFYSCLVFLVVNPTSEGARYRPRTSSSVVADPGYLDGPLSLSRFNHPMVCNNQQPSPPVKRKYMSNVHTLDITSISHVAILPSYPFRRTLPTRARKATPESGATNGMDISEDGKILYVAGKPCER